MTPRQSGEPVTAAQLLHDVFGYTAFRGRQAEVVDHVAGGGDALVLMPTGGGKSLCFQIPALLRRGCGVVVSPLIALMQDQVDALRQNGVRAAYLNSTLEFSEVQATERALLAGELDLLYVAPERLLNERTLALLDRAAAGPGIALMAIDEAHCVSQWGHDFRPEYLQLAAVLERHPEVPRIALTATADETTRDEIVVRLGLGKARIFLASFDRPNIRYTVVEKDSPRQQLLRFLSTRRAGRGAEAGAEAGIVYCLSRKKVEETADWLAAEGFTALPYHAGLDAATRSTHQRRFQREDGVIMVATIAFGMGIDKPDVRFVAHLDLPKSLEAYYQETGRAGRDGEPAEAWMTYGLQDVALQRARIDDSTAPETQKLLEAQKLNALLAYCEAPRCRRQALLAHFGEAAEPCNNCDVCLDPPELFDGTVAAQKFLSAVFRTGQRFGGGHLIDILRGKSSEKMQQYGHDRLPTFGIGGEFDERGWRSVVRQLVSGGHLHVDLAEHGALKLCEPARAVLKGEARVELRRARVGVKARAPKRGERPAEIGLNYDENQRFERLRAWRRDAAAQQGVPAYVILHDRTLRELAKRLPRSIEELLETPGFGEAKVERYGGDLLALLARE
jgi:ATP-dependent DNA helicase RecQ